MIQRANPTNVTVLGSKSQAMKCLHSKANTSSLRSACIRTPRGRCGDHGVPPKGCGGDKVRQVFLLQDGSQAVTG